LQSSAFAGWFGQTRRHWPLLRLNRGSALAVLLFGIFAVAGMMRLTVNDDIRSLQTPPKALLADQIKLGKLLDAPTPVQFYLVRGASAEQVLQREERLKQRLEPLIAKHAISGYQAMSNWIPSMQEQAANRALVAQALLAADGPLKALAAQLGEDGSWVAQMRDRALSAAASANGGRDLTPAEFLKSAASEPSRHLWLGEVEGAQGRVYASIVALRGLDNYGNLPLLKQAAEQLEGVSWVDKVSEISSVLGYYRQYMGWVLLGAYAAIFLLLFTRYRSAAWRVLTPPAVASIATLAALGLLGQPLQLFHVLALMLILGLGVDYGIFLQEQSMQRERFAWLTVGLSAASALLSFGLLALSATPPLHAFGFTMLIGIAVVWLIAPCFSHDSQQEIENADKN
jgi:predicted exporter